MSSLSHWVPGYFLTPLVGVPAPFAAPTVAIADQRDGGTFVATLAGGNGAALNTLYRAQLARSGPLPWVFAAQRTGPGDVTATAPAGLYLWAVQSVLGDGQAWGAPALYAVTDAADPLYQRIIDGAVAVIRAAAIDGLAVYQQKDANTKGLSYPCLMVTPWGEVETAGPGDRLADEIGYPVRVSLETQTLHVQDSQGVELDWRGRVADAVQYQRLPGVPEVQTCLPEHRPVFEPGGADPVTGTPFNQGNASRMSSEIVFRFIARVPRG